MTASIGLIAPIVMVDGVELSDAQVDALRGLRVSKGLRIPARAQLTFADVGFVLATSGPAALGRSVKITTSDGTALFLGEVTGVNLELEHGDPVLTVIADDLSYRMTLGTKVRTFTNVKYSDVVSQIAAEYGLTASVAATETSYAYLIQSDTDFGYVTELADRMGFDWWVDAERKLQFQPIGSVTDQASVQWGQGLTHFAVRASGLHPGQVTVTGWDPENKQSVVGVSASPSGGPTSTLVQPYLQASDLSGVNAITTASDSAATATDAQMLANRAVSRWRAGAVVATGTCWVEPGLIPGGTVQVIDAGPASGTYDVTEVEHAYDSRGFETRFTAGDRVPRTLVDSLSAPAPSSFRRTGLMVGVVTNIGNSELPGRVKVKFPALGDAVESEWARVVSVGAGSGRGMTFLPEVNDEVIVGFEADDITRPVVLGGMYNGQDVGLDYGTADGKVQKRQIVSRLGHVIELADGDGNPNQHIAMTLAGGEHQVYLGKDKLVATVPAGLPLTIKAGDSKLDIDNGGAMTLQAKKITIKADTDVEISGLNITLKSTAKLAGSGAQVQMQGTAQAELSSSGQTAVKGAIVMIN